MSPVRKGPISQRALLVELRDTIDAAMAANSTAHRDIARAHLRELLDTTNWRTYFVLHNLSSRRCRYLSSIGYWVPFEHWYGVWHGKSEPKESQDD